MYPKVRKKYHERTGSLVTIFKPYSAVSEEYRSLRSNIHYAMLNKTYRSIIVTSAGPGEGKSTIAANTAAIFASQRKKVLLVDADLRKPSLKYFFNYSDREGLSTLLNENPLDPAPFIKKTYQENLHVLPSGPLPPNPSELLASPNMEKWIKTLEKMYDLVIYDLPPIVTVTDAQIMAGKTDGVLFVVRHNTAKTTELAKAKKLFDHARANIIGVVYNGKEKKRKKKDGYGQYYKE